MSTTHTAFLFHLAAVFGFAVSYTYWYSYYWLYGTDHKHVSSLSIARTA